MNVCTVTKKKFRLTCSVNKPLGQSLRNPLCLEREKKKVLMNRLVSMFVLLQETPNDSRLIFSSYNKT